MIINNKIESKMNDHTSRSIPRPTNKILLCESIQEAVSEESSQDEEDLISESELEQ